MMVESDTRTRKLERFAPTPWTIESAEWQALDRHLSADHLARKIAAAVRMLDLDPLLHSYFGVGKRALQPDLLVAMVLYEMRNQRPSPAQWTRDARESEPVRWLLLGMEPSRAFFYEFYDRVAPFVREWNTQVLAVAIAEDLTSAKRAALDSTSVSAHASRRQYFNEERLDRRRTAIDGALARIELGEPASEGAPGWLAKTATGLREQKKRYQRAAEVLFDRKAANAERRSSKRKPVENILVSAADTESLPTRDKLSVFRPLYNVQVLRDLDSPLIFSYAVKTQNNDNGALQEMVEQMADSMGRKPAEVMADSGYVSMRHLEFCELAGITLYGPSQEHDFSAEQGKKPQSNQHTTLPKSAFTWLEEEQVYRCPEGHRLEFRSTATQQRTDHSVALSLYACPAKHCLACPQQKACTRTPKKGRTVSRMANEHLLEALRSRMRTEEGKKLYKRRSQTIEQTYADLKEHRGLRRFHGRGVERATAEVGLQVLASNLFHVQAAQACQRSNRTKSAQTTHAAYAA